MVLLIFGMYEGGCIPELDVNPMLKIPSLLLYPTFLGIWSRGFGKRVKLSGKGGGERVKDCGLPALIFAFEKLPGALVKENNRPRACSLLRKIQRVRGRQVVQQLVGCPARVELAQSPERFEPWLSKGTAFHGQQSLPVDVIDRSCWYPCPEHVGKKLWQKNLGQFYEIHCGDCFELASDISYFSVERMGMQSRRMSVASVYHTYITILFKFLLR